MELIKPFLKYSRIYRSTTAESSKSVRKFIYKLWSKETECIRAALKNHHYHQTQYYAKCLFCNEAGDSDDDVFCKYCFFPRLGIDEEFATYCLLSACFYERQRQRYRQQLSEDRVHAALEDDMVRLRTPWKIIRSVLSAMLSMSQQNEQRRRQIHLFQRRNVL
ncbi:ORF109 [Spodoptera exigua multiple nucleopolyhedrovirus]|uniref:ORF109 n=1 Tax=Spodoptera exigua nuclear polyhedrosis virus (strain US) TaxID=31506 RepID=Q9J828_NPVSE|nr:ORF109 [Spodoptera exigua multiple nucleopolyhedrovirus]AAF33638.1 ORF109 [Spodoptera exigua multiple nucleopolyhedrovirus]